jgi:hypothetical protein
VDESEIGSANETATFGSPFHFSRTDSNARAPGAAAWAYLTFWLVLSQPSSRRRKL